jgi:predicted ferric reductase
MPAENALHRVASTRTGARSTPRWSRRVSAISWILVYLGLAAFPLLLLLVSPVPNGAGFWWDFAMGLGFAGLSMMGLQFVLTARFRKATAPFGIDIIYYFHRWAAVGACGVILGHYAILRLTYSQAVGTANPLSAPLHMTAGRASLLIFLALIASSLWRKTFRIEYHRWRIAHGVLAALGVALAIWHIQGVGYYTASPAKKVAWIAFSGIWLLILLHIRLVRPWLLSRRPYRVTRITPERGDSWTVTVEPQGEYSTSFIPGQFAWLTIGASPFRGKEHPFSFSSSAAQARELQFTIKELGDFTRTVKKVPPGSVAYVDGPYGVFTPDLYPKADGFVFIAGGVGIAPIMSMLRTFADRNDPRNLRLIYGNGSWDRVIFREAIEDLKARLKLSVAHVLNNPPPGWDGTEGILCSEVLNDVLLEVPDGFLFFVCGPKGMIESVQRTLRKRGIPLGRIHFEHFDMA